jgi:phage terminase large subunit
MKPTIKTIPQFLPLYDRSNPDYKTRYKVFKGGRGGRKSWEIAQAALLRGYEEKLLILCTREIQNSIADSIHSLLSNTINRMKLSSFYQVQNTTIIGQNGTEFKFKGLNGNTIDSIKSFEGADIAIVEEAHSVSQRSWDILIPTIRKDGSEIWVAYNPDLSTDPVHVRFALNTTDNCYLSHINYLDNPDCPKTLIDEAEYLKKVDYEAYAHIYLGQVREHSDSQIFKGKYSIESFEPDATFGNPLFGSDWGFSTDPVTLVKIYIKDKTLYVRSEAYKIGCEVNHTPGLFKTIAESDRYVIRADNSRPEMISYVKNQGMKIEAADKWPGCVEDRVAFIRSFERLVIHPDCKHTAEEFRLYSYKTDKRTGDVLPEIMDKHNHCIDAIGYAITPIIRRRPTTARATPNPGRNAI